MRILSHLKYLFALIIALLFTGFSGMSQTNKSIDYPSLGISFRIPNQWVGQEVENGFLMSHPEVPGFVLITTHDLKAMKDIQQEMEQGFILGPSSKLTATSVLDKIRSNALGGTYMGTISGEPAKAYILGLLNEHGLGLTLICGANSNAYSETLKNAGLAIAKSVVFYDTDTKDLVGKDLKESHEWKEKLENCRLTYMESNNSYSSGGFGKKIKIDLCAKGYFNHSSYSSISVTGGGYSAGSGSHKKGSGTWTMVEKQGEVVLQLHFYDKEVYEFTVTIDAEDKTYLNGNRYFRTYEGGGKYSPQCD